MTETCQGDYIKTGMALIAGRIWQISHITARIGVKYNRSNTNINIPDSLLSFFNQFNCIDRKCNEDW